MKPAAPMSPPSWADVQSRMEADGLSGDDIEMGRQQYFNDVVAPRLGEGELESARSQFDEDTGASFWRDMPGKVAKNFRAAGQAVDLLKGVGGLGDLKATVREANRADWEPRAKQAFDFFVGKGLAPHQAAGVVGNLIEESGLRTDAVGDSGSAHGLAQWRLDRKTGLDQFAAGRGADSKDFDTQLEYVWHELNGPERKALDALVAAQNADEAATVFNRVYERSDYPNDTKRAGHARRVLELVGLRPQKTWLAKQGGYAWNDLQVAWHNLANAFEGQQAAEYGELLQAKRKKYGFPETPDIDFFEGGGGPSQEALALNVLKQRPKDYEDYAHTLKLYQDSLRSVQERGLLIKNLIAEGRPATQQFLQQGEDWSEQLNSMGGALLADPVGVVADLGIQSGPTMVAMIASSVVAARSGLPPAAVLGAGGGTSAWMQFGGEYTDRIQRGQTHDQAYKNALLKSGVVGLFDAASLASAGKVMGHVAERGLFQSAGEVAKNLGAQAALGGGGEAWGSYAAGDSPEVRDIGAEMVGELAGAPFEMGGAKLSGLDRLGQTLEREVARGEVPGSADAAARAALDPNGAAARDVSAPVTVDLGGGSAMVDPATGEILPGGGAGGTSAAQGADKAGLALAGLSEEDRAAVAAIAGEPEREPVPTGLAAAVPRARPMDPAEYATAKRADDLDNEGRPFESREAALKVARGRNLAGYYPAQVRRGLDAWVLRPKKQEAKSGQSASVGSGSGGLAAAAVVRPSEAAGTVQPAPVPVSPRLVTKPDGSGWAKKGEVTRELRRRNLDPEAYGVWEGAQGWYAELGEGERSAQGIGPQSGQDGVPTPSVGTMANSAAQQTGATPAGTLQPAIDAGQKKSLEPLETLVDVAAHDAATSPTNGRPMPTEAQKQAGNYAKGHIRVGGLDISVENPAGSERSGVDKGGKPWSVTMQHHYGYVRGSVGRDKDHVDVFVKPGTPEDYAGPVFVVDQVDPATGRFDEHKAMVGFASEDEARGAYQANYAKGWQGAKAVVPMGWEAFKAWVKNPNATRRPAAKTVAPIGPQSGQDDTPAPGAGTMAPVDVVAQRQEEIRFALDLADEARLYASVEKIRGLMAAPGATLDGVITELQRIIDDGRASEASTGGVRPQTAPADETGDIEPVAAKPARPAPPRGGSQPDNAGDRNDAAQAIADRTREPERQRDGADEADLAIGESDGDSGNGQMVGSAVPGAGRGDGSEPVPVGNDRAGNVEASGKADDATAIPAASDGGGRSLQGEDGAAGRDGDVTGAVENPSPALPLSGEGERAESAEQAKARADLEDALKDLGQVFLDSGLFSRKAVPSPEIDEAKLMPVLARLLDASFRLGYHKFKDAARYALETIRERFGDAPADAITLDHLQGAYIAMAGKYQGKGADHKRDVVGVESLAEIMGAAESGPQSGQDGISSQDAGTSGAVDVENKLYELAQQHHGDVRLYLNSAARDVAGGDMEGARLLAMKAVKSIDDPQLKAAVEALFPAAVKGPQGGQDSIPTQSVGTSEQSVSAVNEDIVAYFVEIVRPVVNNPNNVASSLKAYREELPRRIVGYVVDKYGADAAVAGGGEWDRFERLADEIMQKARDGIPAQSEGANEDRDAEKWERGIRAEQWKKGDVARVWDAPNKADNGYIGKVIGKKKENGTDRIYLTLENGGYYHPLSVERQIKQEQSNENRPSTGNDDRAGDAGPSAGTVSGTSGVGATGGGRRGKGGGSDGGVRGTRNTRGGKNPAVEPGAAGTAAKGDGVAAADVGASPVHVPDLARSGDYRVPAGGLTREGSWLETARRNVGIVELVHRIEAENRPATPEEQAELVKFTGWGAGEIRNNLFHPRAKTGPRYDPSVLAGGWKDLGRRVAEVFTKADWKTALRSTQYAHYTSEGIVRGMWRAAERLGFAGGSVLEPGAGIGHFAGLMPDGVYRNSKYIGIEMDGFTAKIGQLLYPGQSLRHGDYIRAKLPRNFFDVAIGNPPFAAVPVLDDPEYAKQKFPLHDYFFAKTLDRVRPGGLMMFVTSRWTMDKKGARARQYLADRADLLGAIRLPQTAFKGNAGTEVVTDVLFFRKREPGQAAGGESWLGLGEVKTIEGKPVEVNEYFARHPDMILGRLTTEGDRLNPSETHTVIPLEGDIEEQFAKAVENLPENVYSVAGPGAAEATTRATAIEKDWNPKYRKEGGVYLGDGGALLRVENGVGVPLDSLMRLSAKEKAWLSSYVPLRDALKQAQYDQLSDGDWQKSLKALNKAYDAFVKAHGRIWEFTESETTKLNEDGEEETTVRRRFKNNRLLTADIDGRGLMFAIELTKEDGTIEKGAILKDRVLKKPTEPKIEGVDDALAVSLSRIGQLDLAHVAELAGVRPDEALDRLGDLVYEAPEGGYVLADEYLSGDVRTKLDEAEAAAEINPKFARNVEALTRVQPPALVSSDVTVGLGATWVPMDYYRQYARDVVGLNNPAIEYSPLSNEFAVTSDDQRKNSRSESAEWGTAYRSPVEVFDAAMNHRTVKVYTGSGSKDDPRKFDPEETKKVEILVRRMVENFASWVWTDAERTAKLLELYNDKFNRLAPRYFNGDHINPPGLSLRYKLHPHQKRAIWRAIVTGNTYFAHAVGAGKTLEMIISGMEQKRLGLINKPMYVVPNHMLEQFAAEFLDAYPAANIMVADEENFATDNRRRFIAQASLNNPDAVIITHSAFTILEMKPENQAAAFDDVIDDLRATLEEIPDDFENKKTRSKIEAQLEKIERAMSGASSERWTQRNKLGALEKEARDIRATLETRRMGGERNPPADLTNKLAALEKAIAEQEPKARKEELNAERDRSILFEDMGVDFLFVDEAHEFRKLDYSTKMTIKGLSPEGSVKALRLFVKTRWLEKQRPGRSFAFASGTPITNTMAELFTVQRFFQESELRAKGLIHFDAWAANFARVKTEYERNATGGWEAVDRMAKFVNVADLMAMVRQHMDVLTSAELAHLVKLPTAVPGNAGKRNIIVTPRVEALDEYMAGELATRLENSRKWKPSPQQPNNPDPVINIITDGRVAALDMRYINPSLPNDPESKLNQLADRIIEHYRETADLTYTDPETGKPEPVKGGTQIVFASLGFGPNIARTRGFDGRAWVNKRLKEAGIPAAHIAWIWDYPTPAAKQGMFKEMRQGKKRILIGSPKNMGTGVNVQKRLTHKIDLDAPWYPSDMEQPDGRILRQGNQNEFVTLEGLATDGTYDSTMYGMVARKAGFIEQAFRGDRSLRVMDDISEAGAYSMAAAIASGDQRYVQMAEMESEVAKLEAAKELHERRQSALRSDIAGFKRNIPVLRGEVSRAEAVAEALQGVIFYSGYYDAVVDGKTLPKVTAGNLGKAIAEVLDREFEATMAAVQEEVLRDQRPGKEKDSGPDHEKTVAKVIGSVAGKADLVLHIAAVAYQRKKNGKLTGEVVFTYRSGGKVVARVGDEELAPEVARWTSQPEPNRDGNIGAAVNRVLGHASREEVPKAKKALSDSLDALEKAERAFGVPFPQQAELVRVVTELANLRRELAGEGKEVPEAAVKASVLPDWGLVRAYARGGDRKADYLVGAYGVPGGAVLASRRNAGRMGARRRREGDGTGDVRYSVNAWHGSPHDFHEFSLHKIGSGEGNQAFGWGLYFASDKSIAEYYRDTLAQNARIENEALAEARNALKEALRQADYLGFDRWQDAYSLIKKEGYSNLDLSREERVAIKLAAEAYKAELEKSAGRLYNVNLAPDEYEYLDWDKPLSQQSDKIKRLIGGGKSLKTGGDFYNALSRVKGGYKEASVFLSENGIPGIKYKDARTRGTERAAYNYVVFDDRLVSIANRYSQNGGLAGSGSTIKSVEAELARAGFAKEANRLMKAGVLKVEHSRMAPAGVPSTVSALWNPKAKQASLFYDRIAPGQVVGKFLHEMTHGQLEPYLRNVIGPEAYDKVVAEFGRLLDKGDPWARKADARARRAVNNRMRDAAASYSEYQANPTEENKRAFEGKLDRAYQEVEWLDEERLAYMLEEYASATEAERRTLPGRVRVFFRRLIATIRAAFMRSPFYRAMLARGVDIRLSVADVAALARAAVAWRAREVSRNADILRRAAKWSDAASSSSELDAMYLGAVERGDMVAAQQMVREAAERAGVPVVDEEGVTAYRVRRNAPPRKTATAYKLFRVKKTKPGQVFALFVGADDPLPQGVWLDAIPGPQAPNSKTGKAKVKSKLGDLAYRPGWHAGDVPLATHIGAKDPEGNVFARKDDEVWAEVEMADDDPRWAKMARANGTKPDGSFSVALADVKEMPVDGMYRYKTNPAMTGQWIISGSMKINRILSEGEVNDILRAHDFQTMPWAIQPKGSKVWEESRLDLGKWGLGTNPARNQKKLLDPVTYDDQGRVIPLSERFNAASDDPRYSDDGRLLAPNGERSKLNPVQWAQVRTPEFKAWFGDWEILAKTAHVTELNLPEWGGDLKSLQRLARQIYTDRLQGREVENLDLRQRIRFTSEGKGEAFGGIKSVVDAQVVERLARLARRAIWLDETAPDARRMADSRAFHTLVAPLRVNGRLYAVKLTVRESLSGPPDMAKLKLYDVAVLKSEVGDPVGLGLDAAAVNAVAGHPSHSGSAITIRQLLTAFNGSNTRHVPQLLGGVDENGEPLPAALADFHAAPPMDRYSDDGQGDDAGLAHVTAARSRSEFARRLRALDDQASRRALKFLTRDQLAEVSADLLPEIESQYLKTARLLDGDRNELHQKGGEFLEPWGRLARERKTRMDAARLAETMHEATLAGVDPDVDYVPVIDLKEGLAKIRKIKAGALINKALSPEDVAEIEATKRLIRQEVTRANEYARIKALWDGLDVASRKAHPKEAQAIEALQKKAGLTPGDRAELDRLRWMAEPSRQIYRKARDFHEHVAAETLEALIGRINATEASKDVKRELISKLRHEFESNRVAAPYFPLYRDGDYWLHYREPGKTVMDTLVKLDKISPEMFIVTVRRGQEWPPALMKLRGSLLKGVGKAFKAEDEARVRQALGTLLTEKREFQQAGERYFELFETAADRDEYRAQYEKAGMEILGAGRRFEEKRSQDGVAPQFVADVEGLLRELPDSPETRGVRDAVWQLYLTTMPEPSMRKHFIHRQKRKGYMEDALRANAHKVFHDGYQLARLRHMHKLNEVLADLKENLAAAETPETYRKVERELTRLAEYQTVRSMGLNGIDAELAALNHRRDQGETRLGAEIDKWNQFRDWYRKGFNPSAKQLRAMARLGAADRILAAGPGAVDRASRYIDELGDFHELLNSPESSAWAQMLNSVGFVWFLGSAVASGVLNTLQTPVVAMPVAGAKYGEAKTGAAFLRAGRQFFSTPKLTLGAVLEGDELAAFHEFQRLGIIDKTLSHDLAGVAERGMDYSDFRFRAMKALSWVFHHTERLNREVTAMAVYRLARDAGQDHENAFWDAVKLVERTHGNYEAANRAAVLRGGFARVATQFKQYAQFTTFLLLRSFRQAFQGATPEVRAEARRALAGILAMETLVAGVHGLPFVGAQAFAVVPAAVGVTWGRKAGLAVAGAELAGWLAAMALGDPDDPDDWEAELRTWLAKKAGAKAEHVIWKGAIDAFSPWAMADRASLSELWWRWPDKDTEDAEALYLTALENIGGPMVGIGKNLFVGGKLVADGLAEHNPEKVARGVETMSPNVLRYLQKAGRFAKEGALTLSGEPVVENLTPAEIGGQLLGFQPSRVVSRYEVNNAIKNRELALKTRRGDIVDRVARGVRQHNPAEKAAGLAAARRFSQKHPGLAITADSVRSSVMGTARRQANTEGGLYLAPKLRGLRERYRFGGE